MDKAPQYRKKPVIIEAFQLPALDNDNVEPFHEWAKAVGFTNYTSERDGEMAIETLEGTMIASPSDWIIKGVKGEFYPCKPDIFALTYEPAEPSPALAKGVTLTDDEVAEALKTADEPLAKFQSPLYLKEALQVLAYAIRHPAPPTLGVLTGEEEEALESLNVNYEINTLADACQAYHLTKRKAHIVARALRRLRAASTQVGVKE